MAKTAEKPTPVEAQIVSLNDRVQHLDGCPATETGNARDEFRVESYRQHSPRRGEVEVTRCRECGAHTITEV